MAFSGYAIQLAVATHWIRRVSNAPDIAAGLVHEFVDMPCRSRKSPYFLERVITKRAVTLKLRLGKKLVAGGLVRKCGTTFAVIENISRDTSPNRRLEVQDSAVHRILINSRVENLPERTA
jgi:hypothetical protein